MSPLRPRSRRQPARKTLRRMAWTLAGGLLVLACGVPALRPPPAPVTPFSGPASAATTAAVRPERPDPDEEALPAWVARHPAAALDWISRQPASAELDAARLALARQLDRLLPRIADLADETERISDPGLRRSAFAEVLGAWQLLDPAAANARLARAHDLPCIERAHLLELLSESTVNL